CFEHAISHRFRTLDVRVNRIDHACEEHLAWFEQLSYRRQNALAIRFARQLNIEPAYIKSKQRGQQTGVIHIGTVSGIPVATWAGVHSDVLPLFIGKMLEDTIV